MVRGIRGAITCGANEAEAMVSATMDLLTTMLGRNEIKTDQLISMLFTVSSDLNATYPAVAARRLGFMDVPLLCSTEIDVPGGLPFTIRVLLHVETEKSRQAIEHVYLRDAVLLRPDLVANQ